MGVAYLPVAKLAELVPGVMHPVDLNGRQLLVTSLDGQYFAFSRQCPHEGVDLAVGDLSNCRIRCTNHNYVFDLQTGACLIPSNGPPLTMLPAEPQGEDLCIRLEW
jgi:nitrite reductase/ring-hydroxylating ferredoxin subunit